VNQRFIVVAAGIVSAVVLGGCSSPQPAALPPGSLPPGTAEVRINGTDAGTSHSVRCQTIGAVTAITTGDDSSGSASAIDSSEEPTVQFVKVRNLGGFTGSYWADLDPAGEVRATSNTFVLTGSANGFNESNPSARVSSTYSIRVAC
jgi:lipoprotein LpqH